jgi:UPF0755 protein
MSKKIQSRNLFVQKKSKSSGIWSFFIIFIVLLSLMYACIFLLPVVPKRPNISGFPVYKIQIKPQSSLSSIADQAYQQGITSYPWFFQFSARAIFVGTKLKPGTYLLPTGASLGKILLQIAQGDRVRESITIIPGMTIWQIRDAVDAHPALTHQTKGMNSKALSQVLNLSLPELEGIFLPDTYIFDPEDLDINIYRRASAAMQKTLNQLWDNRDPNLPLKSPYDLLILASIIEKETGRAEDRGKIAAVFINRLQRGMPLQTDPTVIYGIGPRFDGNLRKADLRRDSPYNTYMRKGLPPTPIAMPSRESILAALHPAKSDALYFVAKGDGSSHFSSTLGEHENAVDRYQRKSSSQSDQHK